MKKFTFYLNNNILRYLINALKDLIDICLLINSQKLLIDNLIFIKCLEIDNYIIYKDSCEIIIRL